MHELSLCRSLLKQVETVATQYNATAVKHVRLRIGPLSGVDAALLQQAFPIASRGTLAKDAALEIEQCPIRVLCGTCGAENTAQPNDLRCSQCGGADTRLIGGDEMMLVDIELVNQRRT